MGSFPAVEKDELKFASNYFYGNEARGFLHSQQNIGSSLEIDQFMEYLHKASLMHPFLL